MKDYKHTAYEIDCKNRTGYYNYLDFISDISNILLKHFGQVPKFKLIEKQTKIGKYKQKVINHDIHIMPIDFRDKDYILDGRKFWKLFNNLDGECLDVMLWELEDLKTIYFKEV